MIKIETVDGIREIEILPGDAFASKSDAWYSFIIRFFSKIWSHDHEAQYGHAGLLLSGEMTFEAVGAGITISDLTKYQGKRLIIVRFDSVSIQKRDAVLKQLVAKFAGKKYPVWRLILHIFGPLAKLSFLEMPLCSELVAYYEQMLGIRHAQWAGASPDTLVDEWRRWRGITVLAEGVLIDVITQ
jgi:hypothetical protein